MNYLSKRAIIQNFKNKRLFSSDVSDPEISKFGIFFLSSCALGSFIGMTYGLVTGFSSHFEHERNLIKKKEFDLSDVPIGTLVSVIPRMTLHGINGFLWPITLPSLIYGYFLKKNFKPEESDLF